jgi:c-di-GMP-binding flagellar brake protein YcgR
MNVLKLSVGEKIELRPQLTDGTYASVVFAVPIQDVVSEKEFLILPLNDDDLANWLGHVLQLTVVRKNEAYTTTVQVKTQSSERNLSFLHLVILENFKRQQRRAFYRLKISLATEVFDYGKFMTTDLSGSGMAFIADKPIAAGETLKGTLDLKGQIINFSGTVVRCSEDANGRSLVHIEFTDIPKVLQDLIVTFLHKQQLIMLKKGLLQR